MPFDFLILLIVNSFWILGFNRACSFQIDELPRIGHRGQEINNGITPGSKGSLWWVRYYGDQYLPWYIRKPLYDCPLCMGSLHSIYPFFFVYDFSLHSLGLWVIYFVSLCGLASFIDNHG